VAASAAVTAASAAAPPLPLSNVRAVHSPRDGSRCVTRQCTLLTGLLVAAALPPATAATAGMDAADTDGAAVNAIARGVHPCARLRADVCT
jgi:hypothetical protein